MKYNFKLQAEKQKELDKYIKDKINIDDESYWKKRIIALLVELNELSNEIRFFKYWSKKPASNKEIILDEYVDVIHFALSIGNTLNINNWTFVIDDAKRSIELIYFDITSKLMKLVNDKKDIKLFKSIMFNIIEYAWTLNYSMEDIEDAYNKKNKINYERQNSNY